MKNRIFFEAVFKNNPNWTAEDAWKFVVSQNKFLDFPDQKKCSETVYREKWGRIPGELSPEEQLAEDKRTLAKLQRKIEAAESSTRVDPVKDVPVEPVIEETVVVEEVQKPKQRGRPPRAMTLADLQPK